MQEQEIWKDIEGYEGKYQVSNMGRVRSMAIGNEWRMRRPSVGRGGYYSVSLAGNDGRHRVHQVQRLVASAFVPGYREGLYVNHKDENRQNNRWDNLEWVTMTENNNYGQRNRHVAIAAGKPVMQISVDGEIIATYESAAEAERLTGIRQDGINRCCCGRQAMYGGYRWQRMEKDFKPVSTSFPRLDRTTVDDLDGEEWRPVVGFDGYMVSNLGRVKSLNYRGTGEGLLRPHFDRHGYLKVRLRSNGKGTTTGVHQLVARAFVPGYKPGLVVNHKDENPANPLPDNLEWVTTKENCNYGNHNERLSQSMSKVPVLQMTLDGTVIAEHRNIIHAAKALRQQGIKSAQFSMISMCCLGAKGITTAYGYRWRRKQPGEQVEIHPAAEPHRYTEKNRKGHAIAQLTMDGRLVGTYPSMLAAVKANGFPSHSTIGYCLSGKAGQAYGYQWRHVSDLPDGFLQQAVRVSLAPHALTGYQPKSRRPRPVVQMDDEGRTIATYPSLLAAARALGKKSHGPIACCLNGGSIHAYGFRWRYKDSE